MASAWIRVRATKPDGRHKGAKRYRVEYRLGGRESRPHYAGSFERKTDAEARVRWITGELAARRVPDLRALDGQLAAVPTLRAAAAAWLASRLDIAETTRTQHRVSVALIVEQLGAKRRVDGVTAADVAAAVATLAETRKRETIRKAVNALAMTLDHAGIAPNPARDKRAVKLPRGDREEINPPTAAHVLAVHDLLPPRYRLPLLVLDATGMRLGELERLSWGDVDEQLGRWRVSAAVSKTSRARWVRVPPEIFAAVLELCPRDDRVPGRRVFEGFAGDAFRTHLTRCCTAAGVPAFSPHDLRHRRISLLLRAEDPLTVSRLVGHARASMSLDVYGHVLPDVAELDYVGLLGDLGRSRGAAPGAALGDGNRL